MLGLGPCCGWRHFATETHEDLKPYPNQSQNLEQSLEYLLREPYRYDEVKTLSSEKGKLLPSLPRDWITVQVRALHKDCPVVK